MRGSGGRGVAALLIAAALVGAACSTGSGSGGDTTEVPATAAPPTSEPAADPTTTTATIPTSTGPPATDPPGTDPITTDTLAPEGSSTPPPSGSDPASTPAPSPTAGAPGAVFDGSQIDAIVEGFVADEGLDGAGLAIVDRDGGVVHEAYWGEFDADRVSLVASSSKMVAAGVLAHLADEGLVDLDTPVAEQFGDVAPWTTVHPAITPAQLVSNSSGLPGLTGGLAYGDYSCQYEAAGTLQECAAQMFTTTEDDAAVIPPDTEFRYGGAQWQVAGAVAEVAAGRTWAELVDEVYVEPCGLEAFGFTNHWTALGLGGFTYPTGFDGDLSVLPETGNPNIEGGLYTTVGDYAAVLLMHLRDGRCGDTQVLSPAALERLHADRTGQVYDSDVGYAMGWFVDRATGRLTDPGAYGSVAWLDLDAGHGGFLVVEADGATGNRLAAQLYDPVAAALAAP